jgi:hypothetical protein
VTILSPFLDSRAVDEDVHERVGAIAALTPGFGVAFRRVRRWPAWEGGPGVVWLEPEPGGPFTTLTRAVWAAFPETPPYGRHDDDLVAHLTVASDDAAAFDAVELEAARSLPFERLIHDIAWLVERADGRWWRRRAYPLRPPGSSRPASP